MVERVKIDKPVPSQKVKVPKSDDVGKPDGDNEEAGGENYEQIIYVNPKWRMSWDGLQYIMQNGRVRATGKKTGETVWVNVAYIRFFGEALLWLARRQINSVPGIYGGVETLQVLNDRLDAIENEIRTTMKDFMRKKLALPGEKIPEEPKP